MTKAHASVFDQLVEGLQSNIEEAKGLRELVVHERYAPPPVMASQDVTKLRHKLQFTEAQLGHVLNVSPRTVRAWEAGSHQPNPTALRLMQLLSISPEIAGLIPPSEKKTRLTRKRV